MNVLLITSLLACSSGDSNQAKTPAEIAAEHNKQLEETRAGLVSNLVMISLDTVSAEHMRLYGGTAEAPNLEKLGQDGVVYTNAYTHFPETAISHWTMMTGVLPDVHGDVPANGTSRYTGPTLAERLRDAGYQTAAFIGGETLTDRSTGLSRGFETYDDQHAWNRDDLKRPGKEVADKATQWIEEKKKSGKPFFAFVHFFDAHFPYTPAAPWDKKYDSTYNGSLTGSDADLMPFRDGKKTPTTEDLAHIKALYQGEISELDAILKPLLDAADDDKTMIVVTSDHGESFGHDYWFNHRDGLWDDITHVPLIMNGPNVPPHKRVGALTGLVDVMPTILDVLNLEPLDGVNGTSTRGVWTSPVLRPAIFSVTDPKRPSPQIAKRTLSQKLIAKRVDGKAIMDGAMRYAMSPDPQEADPTATLSEEFSEIGAEYNALLLPIIKKWQGDVPKKATVKPPPTPEEHERLKALGYVDGPAKAPTPE